ncbi:MAG: hypothetical protein QOF40_3156, partial [Actinomycetota bacterium]|nr:hypothetical protein [Actinomycetota bacterium]
LQRRHSVLPGVTGLWQIEGRDDPDFSAYEIADIYYVENWSVSLDVAIMVRTFAAVVSRIVRSARRSREVIVLE